MQTVIISILFQILGLLIAFAAVSTASPTSRNNQNPQNSQNIIPFEDIPFETADDIDISGIFIDSLPQLSSTLKALNSGDSATGLASITSIVYDLLEKTLVARKNAGIDDGKTEENIAVIQRMKQITPVFTKLFAENSNNDNQQYDYSDPSSYAYSPEKTQAQIDKIRAQFSPGVQNTFTQKETETPISQNTFTQKETQTPVLQNTFTQKQTQTPVLPKIPQSQSFTYTPPNSVITYQQPSVNTNIRTSPAYHVPSSISSVQNVGSYQTPYHTFVNVPGLYQYRVLHQ